MSVFSSSFSGYGNPAGFSTAYTAPTPTFTPAFAPANFSVATPAAASSSCPSAFPSVPLNNQGFIGQMFQLMQQMLQMMGALMGQGSYAGIATPVRQPAPGGAPFPLPQFGGTNPAIPSDGGKTVAQIDGDAEHAGEVLDVIKDRVDPGRVLVGTNTTFDPALRPLLDSVNPASVKDEKSLARLIDVAGQLTIEKANLGISDVIKNHPGVKTINMSIGMSKARILENLLLQAENDPAFGEQLRGMFENRKALMDFVNKTVDNSTAIKDSIGRYNQTVQRATDQGVLVVVASGNERDIRDAIQKAGITPDEDFDTSFLARNTNVLTVGATDDKDNANPDDDTIADFSTNGHGQFKTQVLIDGVNVHGKDDMDGTSFSAPQIAGLADQIRRINPGLSNAQLKQILAQSAGSHKLGGIPVVDPNRAIEIAQKSLLPV